MLILKRNRGVDMYRPTADVKIKYQILSDFVVKP